MNIAVMKYNRGGHYFRPDTTLNRELLDFYMPDGIDAALSVPCIYTRITKTGKCIGAKFAGRYFSGIGTGVLISAVGLPEGEATCMDSSSLISGNLTDLTDISRSGDCSLAEEAEAIAQAIITISQRSSLRIGDIVAIETGLPTPVAQGDSIAVEGRIVKIL